MITTVLINKKNTKDTKDKKDPTIWKVKAICVK